MGAHIGDVRHLQKALHSAVLAVFAVHHREGHVDLPDSDGVALKAQQPLTPDGRNRCRAVVRMRPPGAGRQHGIVAAAEEDPLAFRGDANGKNGIFFLIDVVQNGLRGAQGDLMLRTDTAEQNTYAYFFQTIASLPKNKLEICKIDAIITPKPACHSEEGAARRGNPPISQEIATPV